MNNTTITPELQHILDGFAQQNALQAKGGKACAEYRNLVEAIEQTPLLLERMNEAARLGTFFQHIHVLDENVSAGGEYDPTGKALCVKLSSLNFQGNEKTKAEMIGTLGHELQHAYFAQTITQARQDFDAQVSKAAHEGPLPNTHGAQQDFINYTQPFQTMLAVNAKDESLAALEGWNCVVSYLHHKNPAQVLTVNEVANTYARGGENNTQKQGRTSVMNSGYTLNADLSMSPTETNLQAMQRDYYDRAQTLGYHKNSDYPNYYAADLISTIAIQHTSHAPEHSKLMIDMQGSKISEMLVEQKGLSIDFEKNMHRIHQVTYYDPATPTIARQFDHTADTVYDPAPHERVANPNAHQYLDNGHPDIYTPPHVTNASPPQPAGNAAAHTGAPKPEVTANLATPAPLTHDTLPPAAQTLLAHSEDKVRELFAREKLDYDKQHGHLFTLATAKLAAERGMENFEFIGVDKQNPQTMLAIGEKPGLILKTASTPTAEVGAINEQQVFQSLKVFAQEKEHPSVALQQTPQQELPTHKGPAMAR